MRSAFPTLHGGIVIVVVVVVAASSSVVNALQQEYSGEWLCAYCAGILVILPCLGALFNKERTEEGSPRAMSGIQCINYVAWNPCSNAVVVFATSPVAMRSIRVVQFCVNKRITIITAVVWTLT